MLTRLIDFLKTQGVTAMFTSLTAPNSSLEASEADVSSLMDTWGLRLLDVYLGSEGVLTGAARVSQEGREKAAGTLRQQQLDGRRRELDRKRQIFEARMTMLRAAQHC